MAKQLRIKPSMSWEEKVDITDQKVQGYAKYKPAFKEWMLNLPCKKHFFDHQMYFRCWQIHQHLRDDNDHFIVMLAPPGTGKSTLMMQMGATISPEFRLNQISYDFEGFIDGITNQKRYDVFDIDEGALVLNAADRSSEGQMLDKLSAIMRQFNLCVGICLVDFLQLRRHFRDARINTLIIVLGRGKYRVLTGKAIDAVRQQIRNKNGNIHAVRYPTGTFFNGYFSKEMPILNDINEESYLKLKHKNADKFINELKEMAGEVKDVDKGKFIGIKEAAEILNVNPSTVRARVKDKTLPAKQFGTKWLIEKDSIIGL